MEAFDAVVIGAGVSGVPAAVAAARAGARTLLLERLERPGGLMISGLGFPVCGLFYSGADRSPAVLNPGFPERFYRAVCIDYPDAAQAMGRVTVCRCPADWFEIFYRKQIEETPGLTACFGVRRIQMKTNNQQIQSISFRLPEGEEKMLAAGQVIDCTGNGAVLAQSGADCIVPTEPALGGFCIRLVRVRDDELLPIRIPYVLRQAGEAGVLPGWCRWTTCTPDGAGSLLLKFNLPAATPHEEVERDCRCAVDRLIADIAALRRCRIEQTSPGMLPREGVRLRGRAVLRAEDVRSARSVEHPAARGAWPIEFWDGQRGPQFEYLPDGACYEIPLDALRSVNIENLWAAGRLISAESMALASARVMGIAMATGEAAGRAAAEAVR